MIRRKSMETFERKKDVIIDIGGGPGMGHRIIDELGIEATVMNIEPSTTGF